MMAEQPNYNEVTHSVYPPENPDPMYHWDAHFPERLSRLHLSLEFSSPVFRRNRRAKERAAGRYKTQPITFDEITEVDEDSSNAAGSGASDADQLQGNFREAKKTPFRNQASGFSRSVDGLVLSGYVLQAKSGSSTGSDKENTPCDPDLGVHLATADDDNNPRAGVDYSLDGGGSDSLPTTTTTTADVVRHRRKRSGRQLRNRNTVEEVPETEKMEESG